MRSLAFAEVFAMLPAVRVVPADLAGLREWIASLAHPAACIAVIEQRSEAGGVRDAVAAAYTAAARRAA